MRITTLVAAVAVAALFAAGSATAQTGMKNGSADVNTTKARCSPGDPNVLVDPKKNIYMMDTAANHASMSAGAKAGSMAAAKTRNAPSDNSNTAAGGSAANASGTTATGGSMADKNGAMTGMKSMCKSEADSMGAKIAPSSMQKKSM